VTTLSAEPRILVAGASATWTRSLPDYTSAGGWDLLYAIARADYQFTVTGADGGGGLWTFSILEAETETAPVGRYAWHLYARKDTERIVVSRGTLEMLADLLAATSGTDDALGYAHRLLEALDSLILGKALAGDALAYTILGRSITTLSPTELVTWRDRVRAEVRALDAHERGRPSVRFRTW
jgi:hypothetical protein